MWLNINAVSIQNTILPYIAIAEKSFIYETFFVE